MGNLTEELLNSIGYVNKELDNDSINKVISNAEKLELEKLKEIKFNDEIEEILINLPTQEDGGKIAISGFYYQMQVSLIYLKEVLEEKWDGIFIDHHQDIIVYNEKHKIIKFIQVKTKNVNYSPATDTNLIRDWISGLFNTFLRFPELKEYKPEFEIVSNCYFQDTPNYKVECFYNNSNKSMEYTRKEKNVIDEVNKKLVEQLSEENVNKLFENFTLKHYLPDILQNTIRIGIPEAVGFSNNNQLLPVQTIDLLIGRLFKTCYFPEDSRIQLLNNKKIDNIRNFLNKNIVDSISENYHDITNDGILKKFLSDLKIKYDQKILRDPFRKEFISFSENYVEEIKQLTDTHELTLTSIMNRYLFRDKDKYTLFDKKDSTEYDYLLKLMLFLKVYYNSEIDIEPANSHIFTIIFDEIKHNILGYRKVDESKTIDEIIKEFRELFRNLEFNEQVKITLGIRPKIIFSGYYDDCPEERMGQIFTADLEYSEEITDVNDKLDELSENNISMVQSEVEILYVPYKLIDELESQKRRYPDLSTLKNKIGEEIKLR